MSVDATKATWLLSNKEVTSTQKLMLLSYADRAGENHECWPSNKRLSHDTGLKIHTICKNKQILISKGLIAYTGEKKGRSKSVDVVRLNYVTGREYKPIEKQNNKQQDKKTINKSYPQGYAQNGIPFSGGYAEMGIGGYAEMGIGRVCRNGHTESKRKNLKEEPLSFPDFGKSGESDLNANASLSPYHQETVPAANSESKLQAYKRDSQFMQFYNAYPKKVEPRDAYKAFVSVVGHDESMLNKIMDDLKVRKDQHDQWKDIKYIPYPAQYLRKGGYDSEIVNAEAIARVKVKEAEKRSQERLMAQDKKALYEQEKVAMKNINKELAKRSLPKGGSLKSSLGWV